MRDEMAPTRDLPAQMKALICTLCLMMGAWAQPSASWSKPQPQSTPVPAVQSLDFSKRSISASEVSVTSDFGVGFDEATEITAPEMAGSRFVEFESTFGRLKALSGDYFGFERIDVPTELGIYGSEIVRFLKGRTVQAVGGHPLPAGWIQPAQHTPTIPGFRYVASNRIIARVNSHRYVGLWQAERGNETLVVAFDEPSADHPSRPLNQILARLPFKAAVISTTSGPHGGPTSLRMVTDPDQNGRFWLVNLLWPTSHAGQ